MALLSPEIQGQCLANLLFVNQTYLGGWSVNIAPPLAFPELCFGLAAAFLGPSDTVYVGKLGYKHSRSVRRVC